MLNTNTNADASANAITCAPKNAGEVNHARKEMSFTSVFVLASAPFILNKLRNNEQTQVQGKGKFPFSCTCVCVAPLM